MNWPEPRPIAEAPVDDNVLAWWPPSWGEDGEWAISWKWPDGRWMRVGGEHVPGFEAMAPTAWVPLPPPPAQEGDSA